MEAIMFKNQSDFNKLWYQVNIKKIIYGINIKKSHKKCLWLLKIFRYKINIDILPVKKCFNFVS